MTPLIWNEDKPSVKGFYFWRISNEYGSLVHEIEIFPKGAFILSLSRFVSEYPGQWSGPIPLPVEAESANVASSEIEQAFIVRLCQRLGELGVDTSDWDGDDDPAIVLANCIAGRLMDFANPDPKPQPHYIDRAVSTDLNERIK